MWVIFQLHWTYRISKTLLTLHFLVYIQNILSLENFKTSLLYDRRYFSYSSVATLGFSGVMICRWEKQYLSLPPTIQDKVNEPKVGLKWALGEGKVKLEPRLDITRLCWSSANLGQVSLMSLAGHGPKHRSGHGCLITAWTGPRGSLLYLLVNDYFLGQNAQKQTHN